MKTYDRTDKSENPRCNQCGSTSPEKGFTEKVVVHRGRDEYSGKACVVKSRFTVCAGTPCGSHLQMAFEG